MKLKYVTGIFALGLLALVNTSCEDADNAIIENLVYFSEAASKKVEVIPLKDTEVTVSLTVRLAKAIGSGVNATIDVDESILADYNQRNETNYKMIDSENLEFVKKCTIEAGNVSSEAIPIHIRPFVGDGSQYAIPISITSVDGVISKSEASSKFIFVLEQPLSQPVPKFIYSNQMQVEPMDEQWGEVLSNYTLEWRSKMSAYRLNNQAIFSFAASEELYIRFGDAGYANRRYDFLQVKTMGSQFDTGDPNKGYGLKGNEWYHFAITYDANAKTVLLYQNGTQVASLPTAGNPLTINGMSMISSGGDWFVDKCELCQVRLWKTTRSAGQIKANMDKAVDPNSKDLLLYLPMNEGTGSILNDVTGHGHNTTIGNKGGNANTTWTTYTFGE